MIYLDNAATTKVDSEVVAAMLPYFESIYGNSATQYNVGLDAAEGVAIAREQVANLIGCSPLEVFFTSGGTESDNWAIIGSTIEHPRSSRYIITSEIEHHAITHTAEWASRHLNARVSSLPVDSEGIIQPEVLEDFLKTYRPGVSLVSIMHANNEIGTILPIEIYSEICRSRNILFHTDAVQSVGKIPINVKELGVDLLSLSAHKFHGPKGVGALYIKEGTPIKSLLSGGGQEMNLRAGTTNVPGIVGLGKAAELALRYLPKQGYISGLAGKLSRILLENLSGAHINGSSKVRIGCNVHITIPGIEANAMLDRLNELGVCAAAGSACNCDDPEPSHVLTAIGLTPEQAHSSLRLTLSRYNNESDIEEAAATIVQVAKELRNASKS